MFKGQITAGAYTSGYLPISLTTNTNNVFKLSNNQVSVKASGLVDVKANIVITASSVNTLTAQLYGNGNAINGAAYSITTAAQDTYTLTINDVVHVINQTDDGYATIGIQLTQACTIVGGDIICEYRQ